DLRGGDAVWHRQDVLLADHARGDGGAVPEGGRPDAERDFRHRHDRGGRARLPAHRRPAGTDGQCRTATQFTRDRRPGARREALHGPDLRCHRSPEGGGGGGRRSEGRTRRRE
ncbi:MAG: hypothetical protein ACK56I_32110, partial [bacterium]